MDKSRMAYEAWRRYRETNMGEKHPSFADLTARGRESWDVAVCAADTHEAEIKAENRQWERWISVPIEDKPICLICGNPATYSCLDHEAH